MPTFLLQLLALTLSALAERLARELDEEFGNYDRGAALPGPALCQEKETFDKTSCLKKDLRCFVLAFESTTQTFADEKCVSRCDWKEPYTADDDFPQKSQKNCEKHGFCTWAPLNDVSTKCKEKAGCQGSWTEENGLDATNFKRCLHELDFRAFKECGKGTDHESCFEPEEDPLQCDMQKAFEVANPIDCMLQGESNRPIGQRTVVVTVKKKGGKKVIECQRFEDKAKNADKPFWADCKTPKPFAKEGQPNGEAISELTAGLEQYTFVRYGNDAIKACRDFQGLKEKPCKEKNCSDHQNKTVKALAKCLTKMNFEPFAKDGDAKLINYQDCDTRPESWHRVDSFQPADCLAFGPGVIIQIKKDGNNDNVYCTRMPETCVTRKWPMAGDEKRGIVDLTGVYFARTVAPDPFD